MLSTAAAKSASRPYLRATSAGMDRSPSFDTILPYRSSDPIQSARDAAESEIGAMLERGPVVNALSRPQQIIGSATDSRAEAGRLTDG